MTPIEKRLADLLRQVNRAWEMLGLEKHPAQISDLETKMSSPNFWDDQARAKSISQELASLKDEYERWDAVRRELSEMTELTELAQTEGNANVMDDVETSLHALEETFRGMEMATLFSGPYDDRSVIMTIHAGAGGADAMNWAEMLARMFTRFAEEHDWSVDVLDESRSEDNGIKRVMFAVRGRRAYGYLRSEAGVHRLVRISPFDAEKMRHTSFALVEVMPELDELSEKQVEIPESDLRIDTFMSSGPGGQGVNTTYSAVRITHTPSGIVVTCQNERSQQQNKLTALKVLKSRLFQKMQEERIEKLDELKGDHTSPEWGSQIRSYVLHPYKLVKDHRTQFESQNVDAVLDGALEPFMEAYLRSKTSVERA